MCTVLRMYKNNKGMGREGRQFVKKRWKYFSPRCSMVVKYENMDKKNIFYVYRKRQKKWEIFFSFKNKKKFSGVMSFNLIGLRLWIC